MVRTRHLIAAAALLLALPGCASEPQPKRSNNVAQPQYASPLGSTAPATSGPPVDGGTYDSPLLLVDALRKGGIDCTGYSAIAQPRGAVARGNCHVNGDEYTVGIYASASDARAQPAMEAELLKGVAPVDLVLGRNWTVGCPDQQACQAVASVLGGEVFHEDA
ncbi:hypothetical protein ABZV78_02990 [Micromonospora sp. NPDC004540]|uniref:hypothetical protein n=1 Tax=Micromonospora sp. NPDC004540 TaxID=3154457 RepID=UPI0033A26AA1